MSATVWTFSQSSNIFADSLTMDDIEIPICEVMSDHGKKLSKKILTSTTQLVLVGLHT
jgi:hypothetical protein